MMKDLLTQYPVIGAALMVALLLYPLALIFKRNGQAPILALLMLPNIVFPFAGFILTGLAFIFMPKRRCA